jgi:hypothetical protein
MRIGRGRGIWVVMGHKQKGSGIERQKGSLIERRGDNIEKRDKNYLENKFGARGFRILKLLL